jgi:CubicO group peptidase (beta-lactamase class C family)
MLDADRDPIDAALRIAADRGELGLQVAAYLGEELIVDTWTGTADRERERAVEADTLFPCFSVAKSVTATAVHLQAERGLLDYDEPIATYWPEFGAHGKQRATVAHALSHRLGMPQAPPEITPERLGDWDWIIDRLAATSPEYEPGTTNAYLSLTFGWVLAEVVRRTDPSGRAFGQFVQDEICRSLAIDGLWLGVPESALADVAELVSGPATSLSPERQRARAVAIPDAVALTPEIYNRDQVRRVCVPATGLFANARSLAKMFAMLANGGRLGDTSLLSDERVARFATPRPDYDTVDRTNLTVMPVGAFGYWLADPSAGNGPNLICGVGAGGAVAWADLNSGLSVAICHNRMFAGVPIDAHPLAPIGAAIRTIVDRRRGGDTVRPVMT